MKSLLLQMQPEEKILSQKLLKTFHLTLHLCSHSIFKAKEYEKPI